MSSETKQQGSFGELLVAAEVVKHGCHVYLPFGDNSKTDLLIEDSTNVLHRIQVKTLMREKVRQVTHPQTVVRFYKHNRNYSYAYNSKMFDWFAIVDLQDVKIAWIPSSVLDENKRTLNLRHEPYSRERSVKTASMFSDYQVFPFVKVKQ